METRIPLESFVNFDRCLLSGMVTGIRWSAAMDAYAAALKQTAENRKKMKADPVRWQDIYVVGG